MNIVLIGAPGSGKGTQSRYLIDKHGFLQLSTGDLLRAAIAEKSEVGVLVKDLMTHGKLVPDEIMINLVGIFVDKNKDKSVIFDGFPRTVIQAESLEGMLKKSANKIDKVIYFSIDPELLFNRLTGRRTCAQCGEIYHIESKPSAKGSICEKCGGELKQRPDDQKEVIGERLIQFEKNTGKIIDFYRQRKVLKEVDCAKDPKIVLEEIEEILALN